MLPNTPRKHGKQRLVEETRALQLRERSRPGRKRRKKQNLTEEAAQLQDV